MVFVYFAFWGLQEEFSTLPCSPCFLHNFGKFEFTGSKQIFEFNFIYFLKKLQN
jgi:hypothetical protein